ncbi:universal stress protein [Halorubellus sp. JP-L1]|uniref:universal stress protein n=1 Tax=Halorubellus sp. JP-L1 TaxID=2715753 RepID=UPI00140C7D1D|nr:universal stress protein [Halorubellus sp. JP-L1]NHN41704.1 universal stress protein [Halorubellus sp. JP-L1]
MVSRVLVPMGDSEMAEQALRHALEVYPSAEIAVVHVVGGASSMMGQAASLALEADTEGAMAERAETVLERARAIASDYDAEIETDVLAGRPAKAIVERAAAFDVVVVGSHGGSVVDRLFGGDVAKSVFEGSPVTATVVREDQS